MPTSRRTLIAGLATVPVAATAAGAAVTATASVDPIFAAIERHLAAMRALDDIDELADPDAYAQAEQEMAALYEAMLATVPRTIAGCKALVDYLMDLGADFGEALNVLREALERLAARGAP
jgi:hypothetical protein